MLSPRTEQKAKMLDTTAGTGGGLDAHTAPLATWLCGAELT